MAWQFNGFGHFVSCSRLVMTYVFYQLVDKLAPYCTLISFVSSAVQALGATDILPVRTIIDVRRLTAAFGFAVLSPFSTFHFPALPLCQHAVPPPRKGQYVLAIHCSNHRRHLLFQASCPVVMWRNEIEWPKTK